MNNDLARIVKGTWQMITCRKENIPRQRRESDLRMTAHDVSECLCVDANKLCDSLRRSEVVDLIVALRCSLNMSQLDVADVMGTSVRTIRRIENSRDDEIKPEEIKRYLQALLANSDEIVAAPPRSKKENINIPAASSISS